MTTQSNSTSNIENRAMLVNLSISRWSARKLDKNTSARIARESNIDPKAGSYYKTLVGGDNIEAIKKAAGEMRTYHYKMTLPWSDEGPRILPADAYFEYMTQMQEYKDKFYDAVEKFVEEYPYAREEARRMLGSLFDEDDYPSSDRVRRKFDVTLEVLPLPAADDFRVDLASEEVERIQRDIEQRTSAVLRQSMETVYDRIEKVLDAFVDRLEEEDTIFRNSLVENARELVGLLPKFNLTNDPKLNDLAAKMDKDLCKYTPDQLRNSLTARKETFESAKTIKKDLTGFLNGDMQ